MLRAVLIVCMVLVSLASVGGAVVPHHAEHCLTSVRADTPAAGEHAGKEHAGHVHSHAETHETAMDADRSGSMMNAVETACPPHACVACIDDRSHFLEAPQVLSMARSLEEICAVSLTRPDGPLRPPRV